MEQLAFLLGADWQNRKPNIYHADGRGDLQRVSREWSSSCVRVFEGDLTCCMMNHMTADGTRFQCDKESFVVPMLGLYGQLLAQEYRSCVRMRSGSTAPMEGWGPDPLGKKKGKQRRLSKVNPSSGGVFNHVVPGPMSGSSRRNLVHPGNADFDISSEIKRHKNQIFPQNFFYTAVVGGETKAISKPLFGKQLVADLEAYVEENWNAMPSLTDFEEDMKVGSMKMKDLQSKMTHIAKIDQESHRDVQNRIDRMDRQRAMTIVDTPRRLSSSSTNLVPAPGSSTDNDGPSTDNDDDGTAGSGSSTSGDQREGSTGTGAPEIAGEGQAFRIPNRPEGAGSFHNVH